MSRLTSTPQEALEITIKKFNRSKKGPNDYIELYIVIKRAVKEGMSNEEAEQIIKNALNN